MLYYNYPVLVLNTNSGANCSLLLPLPLLHLFTLTFEERFSEITRLKLGWKKKKENLAVLFVMDIKKESLSPMHYWCMREICDNSWKSVGDTPHCLGLSMLCSVPNVMCKNNRSIPEPVRSAGVVNAEVMLGLARSRIVQTLNIFSPIALQTPACWWEITFTKATLRKQQCRYREIHWGLRVRFTWW